MKKTVLRIILIILLGITFTLIFHFSNEPALKSENTSGKVTRRIIDIFPYTKDLIESQKIRLQNRIDPIIRKLAHISIYTMVGILIMLFLSTYDIILIKKILISIVAGITYAISDEMHQYYIPRQKL